jgi:hypothetical protein
VAFDQALDRGETETCAADNLVWSADERLKHDFLKIDGNPGAGILNFDADILSNSCRPNKNASYRWISHVLDLISNEILSDARQDAGATSDL